MLTNRFAPSHHDGETLVYLHNICAKPRWFWIRTWWATEHIRLEPQQGISFTTTVQRIEQPCVLAFYNSHLCCDIEVWDDGEWKKVDQEWFRFDAPLWWYRP
jgi:hypothetical protein